jgi:hypothetical protein
MLNYPIKRRPNSTRMATSAFTLESQYLYPLIHKARRTHRTLLPVLRTLLARLALIPRTLIPQANSKKQISSKLRAEVQSELTRYSENAAWDQEREEMGKVHELITTHGFEFAKANTEDRLDRLCVETAFAVLSDETQKIGIMHAGFAMTALPHKRLTEPVWIRDNGNIRLRVESGADADGTQVGVPYGSIARMILLYLQSEAVKTRSREVELGKSMNAWLKTMDIDNGGKSYKLVREQSKRLSLCRLTFYQVTAASTQITNGSFVRNAILPNESNDDQLSLWQEVVRLDEDFYNSLIDHPLPVQETAIQQLSGRSMAIDVYVWLAYRLHSLERPTPITWVALHNQFGAGFELIRKFRVTFKENLELALAAYPTARVSADEKGLILYPSAPPVPSRRNLPRVTRQRRLAG